MAGLLSGVLPAVYSGGDYLKRQLNGLLSDPVAFAQQAIGQGNDDARNHNALLAAALQESPKSVTGTGPANQAYNNALANTLMTSVGPLATVWHGTPHAFTKFDASKIGTGEGAQAYGHGLYFAESPEVAGQYKAALSGPETTMIGGKPIDSVGLSQDAKSFVNQAAAKISRGGKLENEIASLEMLANSGHPNAPQMQEAVTALKSGVDRGSLYKVDLPDEHIAKMLDWDKPLSQQHPDVQTALTPYFDKSYGGVPDPNQKLGIYIQDRMLKNGFSPYFSQDMQQAGVPGIKYLDGGSRADGTGSSNFVVFPGNEGLLQILERNGQPVNQLSGLLSP